MCVCLCVSVCMCVALVQYLVRKKLHKKQTPPPYSLPWSQNTDMPIFRASKHVHGHACTHMYTCVYTHVPMCPCYVCTRVPMCPCHVCTCVHTCPCRVCIRVHVCPCHVCTRVHMCSCQGEHSCACAHISLPLPSLTQAGGGISHVVPSQIPRHHS